MPVSQKLIPLLALSLLLSANTAHARDAARTVALSTGSNIATWTLPATTSPTIKAHTTPIIYLHGGPGMYTEDRRIEQGQAFRDAGFTTIYYDQIGSGQSARVPATNYTLARMVADLEALRLSLGQEKIILWGNSWGAQLAVLYGQAYPGHVAGFVFTSPGLFPGGNFSRNYRATKRTTVNISRPLTAAINQIDRKGGQAEPAVSQVYSGRLFDEVVAADMMEGMVCKESTIGQADLPGGANLFVNRMVAKEVERAQPNWAIVPRVPSLVVRGGCDFLPQESAARYQAVTGATKVDLPGLGHALLENPAAVQAALTGFARDALAQVP